MTSRLVHESGHSKAKKCRSLAPSCNGVRKHCEDWLRPRVKHIGHGQRLTPTVNQHKVITVANSIIINLLDILRDDNWSQYNFGYEYRKSNINCLNIIIIYHHYHHHILSKIIIKWKRNRVLQISYCICIWFIFVPFMIYYTILYTRQRIMMYSCIHTGRFITKTFGGRWAMMESSHRYKRHH